MPALVCPALPVQLLEETGLASDQEHGGVAEEVDGVVVGAGEQPTGIPGDKLKHVF